MPTFEEQRDSIIPRRAVVQVPPSPELPNGETIEMPRLTLRRSLMLSRWIDDVSQDERIKQKLLDFTADMGKEETTGLNMVFGVNSLISQLSPEKVVELFVIITGKDETFIDNFWEPGWGFEAIRVSFQQQGFGKMFQTAAEDTVNENATQVSDPTAGEDPLERPTNVVSMPSST